MNLIVSNIVTVINNSVIITLVYYIVSYRVGTLPPPFLREPPLSEANLKNYPLFLTAIQIGACKL